MGIVPDIMAKPGIARIRAGRDPVLERALAEILGPGVPLPRCGGMAGALMRGLWGRGRVDACRPRGGPDGEETL